MYKRQAVAIALNMSYMFSSQKFEKALYEFGPLHSNNDRVEIDKSALLTRVLNHAGLVFGYTTGVMGLGGGTTFGMHEVCYLDVYKRQYIFCSMRNWRRLVFKKILLKCTIVIFLF